MNAYEFSGLDKVDCNADPLIPGMIIPGMAGSCGGNWNRDSPRRPSASDLAGEVSRSFDLLPPPPLAGKVIGKMYTGLSKVAMTTAVSGCWVVGVPSALWLLIPPSLIIRLSAWHITHVTCNRA